MTYYGGERIGDSYFFYKSGVGGSYVINNLNVREIFTQSRVGALCVKDNPDLREIFLEEEVGKLHVKNNPNLQKIFIEGKAGLVCVEDCNSLEEIFLEEEVGELRVKNNPNLRKIFIEKGAGPVCVENCPNYGKEKSFSHHEGYGEGGVNQDGEMISHPNFGKTADIGEVDPKKRIKKKNEGGNEESSVPQRGLQQSEKSRKVRPPRINGLMSMDAEGIARVLVGMGQENARDWVGKSLESVSKQGKGVLSKIRAIGKNKEQIDQENERSGVQWELLMDISNVVEVMDTLHKALGDDDVEEYLTCVRGVHPGEDPNLKTDRLVLLNRVAERMMAKEGFKSEKIRETMTKLEKEESADSEGLKEILGKLGHHDGLLSQGAFGFGGRNSGGQRQMQA